jgi:pilus assembly protein Flp/PilA
MSGKPINSEAPVARRLAAEVAALRRRIAANQNGATAIEYALIASGVGAAIAATVWSFGTNLKANFYDVIAAMF